MEVIERKIPHHLEVWNHGRDMTLIWILDHRFMSSWPGFFLLWKGTSGRSLWI